MLDRLTRIAAWLLPARHLFLAMAAFCIGIFVWALFTLQGPSADSWIMFAIVGLLWSLSAYAFSVSLAGTPAATVEEGGSRQHWRLRMKRGGYAVIALFFAGLSIALIFMSVRLVRLAT